MSLIKNNSNFNIYFIDSSLYVSAARQENLYEHSHFSKAIYYRLFAPEIFEKHDKIIYLDADIVANADISELFDVDITGYLLAGTHDPEFSKCYYMDWNESKNYADKILKMKNPYNYLQSGVLIMNLKQMREANFVNHVLAILKEFPKLRYPDQDVLNIICENKIKFLDLSWNMEWHVPFHYEDYQWRMPTRDYYNYIEARRNLKIIHYSGNIKPWKEPNRQFSQFFWYYAHLTPFYEEIIYKNTQTIYITNTGAERQKKRIKYFFYRLLAVLTFGKQSEKYRDRKKRLKQEL